MCMNICGCGDINTHILYISMYICIHVGMYVGMYVYAYAISMYTFRHIHSQTCMNLYI